MPYFDRFDIAEAHWCFIADYHDGQFGKLYKRFSQLIRMEFHPRPDLCFDTLEDNGKMIYNELETKHGFYPTAWEASN